MTIEDHVKDHLKEQHVTSDQYTMQNGQHQPKNLKPLHENIT